MIGKAMYNPTSKASVLPPTVVPFSLPNFPSNPFIPGAESPGTTPPSVEARISSSVASHDFIFSARLADDDDFEDDDDDDEVSPSPFPSADDCSGKENAPPLPLSTTDTMEDGVRWRRGVECDDDDDGEKASDASTMVTATRRRRRQRGIVEFYSVFQRVVITKPFLQVVE
jgi:hypothetical protein